MRLVSGRAAIALGLALMPCLVCAEAISWRLVEPGSLTFRAVQAGAYFEGGFERFSTDIRFSAESLESSMLRVQVDLTSVATHYDQRDELLRGPEFFNTQVQPLATFTATDFSELEAGQYFGRGILAINGAQVPTTIRFSFQTADDDATAKILEGTTVINRLDFGIGLGDWKDEKWIGYEVTVGFRLRLAPVP